MITDGTIPMTGDWKRISAQLGLATSIVMALVFVAIPGLPRLFLVLTFQSLDDASGRIYFWVCGIALSLGPLATLPFAIETRSGSRRWIMTAVSVVCAVASFIVLVTHDYSVRLTIGG